MWLMYVFLLIIIINPINSYTRSSLLLFKFVAIILFLSKFPYTTPLYVVRSIIVQGGVSKCGTSAVSCFRR